MVRARRAVDGCSRCKSSNWAHFLFKSALQRARFTILHRERGRFALAGPVLEGAATRAASGRSGTDQGLPLWPEWS
jgi:hypothetical protein